MKQTIIFIALLSLISLSSCDKNPYHKKVSNIDVEYSILPFSADIQKLATDTTSNTENKLREQYGQFFDTYLFDIRKNFDIQDTNRSAIAKQFVSDHWIAELYVLSDSSFKANESMYNKKIHNALQYYKYYFPTREIPQFCTFITGVNYSMAIDSNLIAIGIDKYIGADCGLYATMNMESYIRKNLRPEKLVPDLMRTMAENDFPNAFTEDYLLSKMIQCGRYQYFVKCMLPDEPDSVLWGYSAKQMDFCEKSEGEFWKYFVGSGNLLFTTDYMIQKRFLDDGPFTVVFTKDSPSRVGQWIGFKIVESYMKNNPEKTLEDLFMISSSQEIMSKAKYNPK